MTRALHTPGPWFYGDYNELRADRPNDDECILIATICDAPLGLDHNGSRQRPHAAGEAQANAALIAASPDLLKAAKLALNFIANTESEQGITLDSGDALRAAIAKALGSGA